MDNGAVLECNNNGNECKNSGAIQRCKNNGKKYKKNGKRIMQLM